MIVVRLNPLLLGGTLALAVFNNDALLLPMLDKDMGQDKHAKEHAPTHENGHAPPTTGTSSAAATPQHYLHMKCFFVEIIECVPLKYFKMTITTTLAAPLLGKLEGRQTGSFIVSLRHVNLSLWQWRLRHYK